MFVPNNHYNEEEEEDGGGYQGTGVNAGTNEQAVKTTGKMHKKGKAAKGVGLN